MVEDKSEINPTANDNDPQQISKEEDVGNDSETPGPFLEIESEKRLSQPSKISVLTPNTDEGNMIREDVLLCLSRKQKQYRLKLTSTELILQGIENDLDFERYSTNDLFGCSDLLDSRDLSCCHTLCHKELKPSAYVCFYLYPRTKQVLMSKEKLREKVLLVFEVRKPGNTNDDNLAIAAKWKDDVMKLLRNKYPTWQQHKPKLQCTKSNPTDSELTISALANDNQDALENDAKIGNQTFSLTSDVLYFRRYLVIVNPVSGQGNGVPYFREKVQPILIKAGVTVDLLVTERAGHAESVATSYDVLEIGGIITVGGDGLLYEVVNGLRSRDDFDRISNIPLGIIATGSGNGLARSIAEYSKEGADYLKNPVLSSTLAVARGNVIPVNLIEVVLDGKKIYSFLSVGWGLLADIDVESEVLRAIGESIFTIWSLLRLANLRSYKALLSYIPCEKITRTELDGTSRITYRQRDPVFVDTEFISVYSSCQSYVGSDMTFAPEAKPGDGLIHLTYLTKDAGRGTATQFLLGIDKGTHLAVKGVKYVTVKEFSIRYSGGINGTITIDGERVTGEEILIKISPKLLHVFAL